jgi:hypothetical protein
MTARRTGSSPVLGPSEERTPRGLRLIPRLARVIGSVQRNSGLTDKTQRLRLVAMVTALLVPRVRDVNDRLVDIAAQLAEARGSAILVIGAPEACTWVEYWAPVTGLVSVRQMRADAQADLEQEVRRCIRLLPNTISAHHIGWSSWNSPALLGLLRRLDCSAIVVPEENLVARHRRGVRWIASELGAELVTVRTPARPTQTGRLSTPRHPTVGMKSLRRRLRRREVGRSRPVTGPLRQRDEAER